MVNTHARQIRRYPVEANGLRLWVQEEGDPKGAALLLVMGLGCQLTFWPDRFINELVQQGFRVIRFDNRDVGLSERVRSSRRVDTKLAFLQHRMGLRFKSSYDLFDMAADTAHLIDRLDVRPVHLLGASMGGMIAQIVASRYPNRVQSLTVMMSGTNSPRLPLPDYSLLLKLGRGNAGGHEEEQAVARLLNFWQAIQSPVYPTPLEEVEERIRHNYRRAYSPGGTLRQTHAILASGNLKKETRRILAPTLVIHGAEDPLLKPACGRAIYDALTCQKQWMLVKGMAHDMPEPLLPELTEAIERHCSQAHSLSGLATTDAGVRPLLSL